MIMVFEGLISDSLEDEYGVGIVSEPTHTAEDEAYYCESILSGQHDEVEAQAAERDWPEDYFTQSEMDHFADLEADRWERHYWGD